MTKAVTMPDTWPPGVGSLAAGLSAWPELFACYLVFFPATLLQVGLVSEGKAGRRAGGLPQKHCMRCCCLHAVLLLASGPPGVALSLRPTAQGMPPEGQPGASHCEQERGTLACQGGLSIYRC